MSSYVVPPGGGDAPQPRASNGRRRIWVATGLVGLTGVVGLATLGGVAARNDKQSGDRQPVEQQAAAGQNLDNAGPGEAAKDANGPESTGRHPDEQGEHWSGQGEWPGGGNRDQRVKEVPCETDRLIAAITLANAEHGTTLKLARDCTYSLTRNAGGFGLPPITQPITIKGEKSKIVRAANTTPFGIFSVASGGELNLDGVTVKGGQAGAPGGGAINVAAGGTARLKESHLVDNSTTGAAAGGAINNLGTVELEKTTLERNVSAVAGGAINNLGLLKIKESRLIHNTAGLAGGAINNGPTGTTQAYKVELRNNRALGGGGAIANTTGGIVDIHYAEITDNNAVGAGGGVFTALGARTTLRHVTLANNGATLGGGGVANTTASTTTIEDSKLTGNITDGVGAPGIGGGGAILNGPGSTVSLRNTEVSGNQATNGGGISNGGTLSLTTTKIVNNTALTPGGAGGILNLAPANITADPHTVITNNRPTNCTGVPTTICFG